MTWFILTAIALGAPPELTVSALGVVDEGALGGGGAVTVSVPGFQRGAAELVVGGGSTGSAFLDARVQGRIWVDDPEDGALGFVLGGGTRVVPEPLLHAYLGAALQFPLAHRAGAPRLRLDVGPMLTVDGVRGAQLGIGWSPGRKPEPAVEVPPEPIAPPQRAIDIDPPDAQIWIPHPVCAWATAEEAGPLLAQFDGDMPLEIRAPGHLPAVVPASASGVRLAPAPEQGAVVVVGWPGDEVRIDGQLVSVERDGVAMVTAPPGPLVVSVTGSGRTETIPAYVGDGHALWVRVPEPAPVRLTFPAGAAIVTRAHRAQLAPLADALAGARLVVSGRSSAEGDPDANRALAGARADAVMEALRALGVPADQVEIGAVEVGDTEGQAEDRAVLVRMLGPEDG